MNKISYATYIKERLTGFSGDSPRQPGQDIVDFPEFLKKLADRGATAQYTRPCCTGEIGIKDTKPLETDLRNLREAAVAAKARETFMNAASPGVIALFHSSGQAMMRSPPMPEALGLDFSNLPLFTHYLPSGPAGSFRAHGALDGLDRIYAWRVLPAYPELVVLAGSPVAQLLADWRRFAWLTGGLWSLAVLAASILGRQLQRQARRRQRMEQRFGELAQSMPQIVFITNAAGRSYRRASR